jgi:hypothetical protein
MVRMVRQLGSRGVINGKNGKTAVLPKYSDSFIHIIKKSKIGIYLEKDCNGKKPQWKKSEDKVYNIQGAP